MCRRDLHTSTSHFRLSPFVSYQKNLAIHQWQYQLTPGQGHITKFHQTRQYIQPTVLEFIQLLLDLLFFPLRYFSQLALKFLLNFLQSSLRIRMDCNGRIAQHGFRSSCGHDYMGWLSLLRFQHGVTKMPKITFDDRMKNFIVTDSRLQKRIPVHQPFTTVNIFLFKQVKESRPYRTGTDFIQSKSSTFPIATRAELLELGQDSFFVLSFPLPDSFDQCLPPKIVTGFVFLFLKPTFNDGLSGNPGMVGTWHPKRLISLHAFHTSQNILKRIIQRVA